MIAIINKSASLGLEYGKGSQVYIIKINDKFIISFEHKYEDGLAECLEQAAKAVRKLKEI
jgi:hypothetical protein